MLPQEKFSESDAVVSLLTPFLAQSGTTIFSLWLLQCLFVYVVSRDGNTTAVTVDDCGPHALNFVGANGPTAPSVLLPMWNSKL